TSSATSSSRWWHNGCSRWPAKATPWRASAATSSRSCRVVSRAARKRGNWRHASSLRFASPISSPASASRPMPASEPPCIRRPGGGIVGPGVFLARAEENGLIVHINEWVLRQACRDAKSWQRAGFPPLRVGVNLSAVQFRKQSVPLLVAKALAETGLDPRRLDLELTESLVMANTEAVAADLRRLHELGVSISIDDFG